MTEMRHCFLILMVGLCTSPVLSFNANDLNNPKVVEAFVDGVVKPLMAEGHSPSGVFALMKDGRVILRKGYGWQNVELGIPVDPHTTLFRPGSISKLFTWVSVMQLVEQGKLDLDNDINVYLRTFQIEDTYPGNPVTLRHCMTHTPGFEDGFLGYLIIEDPERIIPLSEALKRYQPARVNPPGKIGAYSNYCTSLSGLVVANVSGLSFSEYVKRNIFDVLGMKSSSFDEPLPERLNRNMAVAYKYESGRYVARPYELITNFGPAGALAASADDMLIFGSALLNGGSNEYGRILQVESLDEMRMNQFTYDKRVKGIGLGFLHYPWGNTDTFGHDGGTTAFFSHLGITPSASLVVFSSFSGPGGGKVHATLVRQFYQEFFELAIQREEPPVDDAREGFQRYSGTYLSWRGSFSKVEKLVGLVAQVNVSPDGNAGLMIGDSRFTAIEQNLFRNLENSDLIAFQENKQGEIVGYVRNGQTYASMYKASGYASGSVNFGMLGLSALVFAAVFLRFLYQRERRQSFSVAERVVNRAIVLASVSHLWVLVFGGVVIVVVGDQFMAGIPSLFKFWLVFPIVASLASLYLLFQGVVVWKDGLLAGIFERSRYTLVTACSLFMVWFYYYWNILGFNYLG